MFPSGKTCVGIVALLLTIIVGCGAPRTPIPPTPLNLAAASDLQSALPELIRAFKAESPGVDVVTTFGASGKLAEQIKAGAPFDLFLAANESFVMHLVDDKLVKRESVRPYAVGSLVIAVRAEANGPIESIADLRSPGVKLVAIANPDAAPYGAAAKQALTRAKLWEEIGPKLVQADSVRQAFQFVETGNADVGFVGKALTVGSEVRVVDVDPGLYAPIVQALGVVAASKRSKEAEEFARFVTGPKGQAVLKSFGLKPPPVAASP